MQIPLVTRKGVLFLGTRKSGRFTPRATGFIVSVKQGAFTFYHIVTAEHCIGKLYEEIRDEDDAEVCVRLNRVGGGLHEIGIPYKEWWRHERAEDGIDIAVLPIPLNRKELVFAHLPAESMFVTPEIITENEVGPGDEVFIVGLFTNHHGRGQNIPITRIGTIAAMPEERVFTKYGWIEAYLIETMSIGGLSGSPVFVHLVSGRTVNNITMHTASRYYLLGLVHGHFDISNLNDDIVVPDSGALGSINTGIGVVIPAHQIYETLMQEDLAAYRQQAIERAAKSQSSPDVADSSSTTAVGQSTPKDPEAFASLLSAAAKMKRQGD